MYAIAFEDDLKNVYWTTRCGDTDNYSPDRKDATLFATSANAKALMKSLNLDDEHFIVQDL